jgi:ribonuclease P protein subunit POP4
MAAPPGGSQHIAEELLQRAHPPDAASAIFQERVKLRPLLLRPSSPDPTRDARSKRQYERHQKTKAQRKSKKPKPLSAKQKRALCIYDVPKEQQKYAIYQPLHRIWCEYMQEILGLSGAEVGSEGKSFVDAVGVGPVLASADYHGALVEVVRSRCVSRVGLKGIVVKDTKFTFDIITKRDSLKTVPKEHTVFRFEVPFAEVDQQEKNTAKKPLVFDIYGSQFEHRAPDRANKKFKLHVDPHL